MPSTDVKLAAEIMCGKGALPAVPTGDEKKLSNLRNHGDARAPSDNVVVTANFLEALRDLDLSGQPLMDVIEQLCAGGVDAPLAGVARPKDNRSWLRTLGWSIVNTPLWLAHCYNATAGDLVQYAALTKQTTARNAFTATLLGLGPLTRNSFQKTEDALTALRLLCAKYPAAFMVPVTLH